MKDIERIERLNFAWSEKLDSAVEYLLGEKEVSLVEFTELFRDTFEVIRNAKNSYIYKNSLPKNIRTSIEYMRLLTLVSQYGKAEFIEDESKDFAFTVTNLIAAKLVEYAVSVEEIEGDDGETEYRDVWSKGCFEFYTFDYPCNEEDTDDDSFVCYDVYKGDYSDITELARRICTSWFVKE